MIILTNAQEKTRLPPFAWEPNIYLWPKQPFEQNWSHCGKGMPFVYPYNRDSWTSHLFYCTKLKDLRERFLPSQSDTQNTAETLRRRTKRAYHSWCLEQHSFSRHVDEKDKSWWTLHDFFLISRPSIQLVSCETHVG